MRREFGIIISGLVLLIIILPAAWAQNNYILDASEIEEQKLIGSGDGLKITFYEQDSIEEGGKDLTVTVRDDGTIFLSLVGEVHAMGKTTKQLEREIENRLREFVINPKVRVELVIDLKNQVALLGACLNQGVFSIQSNILLSQFVAKYGGVSPAADLQRVYILREDGEIILVNLEELLINGDSSQDIVLKGGDKVFIPIKDEPFIVKVGRVASVVNVVLQVLILAIVIAG